MILSNNKVYMKQLNLTLLLSFIFLFAFDCLSQISEAETKDITFEKPSGWFEMGSQERLANLKKFEFSKKQLNQLLANDKASSVIAVFYRDDPSKTPGIIPTIQVVIRPKPGAPTFEHFKNSIVRSIANTSLLEDFSLIGEVETPEISGIRSVLLHGRFKLVHQSKSYTIKARTFAIPRDDHFLQISMSGEENKGWPEREFTQFIESIRISK